jgi:hypothetical protein
MHRIQYAIRQIPADEVPTIPTALDDPTPRPMTAGELLNVGIVHLHDDVYSCVHQERRDPDTLVWAVHDHAHPGTVLAEGSHRERHAKHRLPHGVIPHRWHGESPH